MPVHLTEIAQRFSLTLSQGGTTQAQRKLFFNLQRETARLEAEGFSPTAKQIAHKLGVKEAEVVGMQQRMSGRDLSGYAHQRR